MSHIGNQGVRRSLVTAFLKSKAEAIVTLGGHIGISALLGKSAKHAPLLQWIAPAVNRIATLILFQ